jgi:hypothetical protein
VCCVSVIDYSALFVHTTVAGAVLSGCWQGWCCDYGRAGWFALCDSVSCIGCHVLLPSRITVPHAHTLPCRMHRRRWRHCVLPWSSATGIALAETRCPFLCGRASRRQCGIRRGSWRSCQYSLSVPAQSADNAGPVFPVHAAFILSAAGVARALLPSCPCILCVYVLCCLLWLLAPLLCLVPS